MNFNIIQLFIGCPQVKINDLEILPYKDFDFDCNSYQIKCTLNEYEDNDELHPIVRKLNKNLLNAKKLTQANQISFTLLSFARDRYEFIFTDVKLNFKNVGNLVLLTINFTPDNFKIEKLTKD